jgi:3-oxoacyl-[acyl-carrier protein] reductase
MDFTGKTVLVTGGARGIGRAIAEAFVHKGANVVICDIDPEAVSAAAAEMGGRALGIKADVTNGAEVEGLVEQSVAKFGRLDILVNNAGITRDTLLIRMDEKDWDLVLDINLKGAFLCTKAAARVMMKQRYGRIVNISSIIGLIGNAGQANYAASKAGLFGLTKSTARELGSRNVTVNAVAPGFIETEMTKKLSEAARGAMLDKVVLGRPGEPADVAATVLFLASDEAAYVTGQVLSVDGGLAM